MDRDFFIFTTNKADASIRSAKFEDAIACGVSGYLYYKGIDEELALACLGFSAYALRLMDSKNENKLASKCCSFCGENKEANRLFAGPSAFICNNCVDLMKEHFDNIIT